MLHTRGAGAQPPDVLPPALLALDERLLATIIYFSGFTIPDVTPYTRRTPVPVARAAGMGTETLISAARRCPSLSRACLSVIVIKYTVNICVWLESRRYSLVSYPAKLRRRARTASLTPMACKHLRRYGALSSMIILSETAMATSPVPAGPSSAEFRKDWEDRELVEIVQLNILKVSRHSRRKQ